MLMKFLGNFKDLKPSGYTFAKLFASNYCVWYFHNGDKYSENRIWIWKHHGGYVEINDLYGYSKNVARIFCSPELLKEHLGFRNLQYQFVINRKTELIEIFNDTVHNIQDICYKNKYSPEEESKICEEFYNTYRTINFSTSCWLINYIQDMYKNGLINPFEED